MTISSCPFQVRTLPEYMVKRFGGRRISMYLAVLSMILYIFTKISVNLYSGAIFIQQALKWNLYLSIFAVLGLTVLCTLGGGLAAVIYIDVVQFLIMMTGSSILLYLGLDKVGVWRLKHFLSGSSSKLVSFKNTFVPGWWVGRAAGEVHDGGG